MSKMKLIAGVGINDSDYKVRDGYAPAPNQWVVTWRCPIYAKWASMINRCYGNSTQYSSVYKGVTVCDEWLRFSSFKKWVDGQNKDITLFELDKDLLSKDCKIYSPETCVLISCHLNNYIKDIKPSDKMIGVSLDKRRGKFRARWRVGSMKTEWLGYYNSEYEAHKAWQKCKYETLIYLQSQQTDSRVIAGLQMIIDKLGNHIENDIETKSL